MQSLGRKGRIRSRIRKIVPDPDSISLQFRVCNTDVELCVFFPSFLVTYHRLKFVNIAPLLRRIRLAF
jgi:hypothetical protein